MKMRILPLVYLFTVVSTTFVTAPRTQAALITWGGSSGGDYYTNSNWVGGLTPVTWVANTDSAQINSGSAVLGSALTIQTGNALTLGGGNLTTTFGIDYRGGSLTINSGALSGSSLQSNASSTFTLTNGSASFTSTNLNLLGATTLSGGTLTGAGDIYFNASSTASISGSTINLSYLGILGSSTAVQFSAGLINSSRFGTDTGSFLNFTLGSTGTLVLSTTYYNQGAINNFFTDGRIRYNGAVNATRSNFNILLSGGNYYISAIPEPSTALLGLAAGGLLAGFRSRKRQKMAKSASI